LEERQHEVHTEKLVLDHLKTCSSVVKLYSTFHDDLRVFFVLEYVSNGSLCDLLKREGPGRPLPINLARLLISELILAL
jgi:serine/threonine protein kinase